MKVILELCCWKLCSVGKVHQTTLETELSFSEMCEMFTFQNHKKYGPLLPKKQTNDLVMSCNFFIDF